MKTFETENHDIPHDATHYRNECNEFDFAWVKYTGNDTLMMDESITTWAEIDDRYFEARVLEIPLEFKSIIATQSLEEKEVLDSINQKDSCEFDTKFDYWHGKLEESINDGSLENAVKEALEQINNTAAQVESLRDYQKKTQTEHQEEMSALIRLNRMNESVEDFLAGLKGENEWNGEGLPPVGVECEWRLEGADDSSFSMCKVLMITNHTVFMKSHRAVNGRKEFSLPKDVIEFRKPETKQQREERERLDCIKKMYRDGNVDGAESDLLVFSIEGILANLYDAGYRKVVK